MPPRKIGKYEVVDMPDVTLLAFQIYLIEWVLLRIFGFEWLKGYAFNFKQRNTSPIFSLKCVLTFPTCELHILHPLTSQQSSEILSQVQIL